MSALFMFLAIGVVTGQRPDVVRTAAPTMDSRISNRIVGGMDAQRGQYPWIVHWEARGFMCGGTLIHPNAFLTAGHCVKFDANTGNLLRAGDVVTWNLINRSNPEIEVKTATVTSCTRHPQYAASTRRNDISLCTLQVPPTVSATTPAQISPGPTPLEYPPAMLTIAGWGKVVDSDFVDVSSVLQVASLPVVSTTVCNDAQHYGSLNLVVQPSQLCAGYEQGGVDACQGDSGGPLFYRNSATGAITLIGITSFGEGCAAPQRPGIYTRVSYYFDWIKQTFPPICDIMNCAPTPAVAPSSPPTVPQSPTSNTGKGSCFDLTGKTLCGQAGRSAAGQKPCFCDMYCADVNDCCDDIAVACPGTPTSAPLTPTPKPTPKPPSAPTPPPTFPPTNNGARVTTCRPPGSSSPSCGMQGYSSLPPACYCDTLCSKAGDCCSDIATVCPGSTTPSAPTPLPAAPTTPPTSNSGPTKPPTTTTTTCRSPAGGVLCGQQGFGGNCFCDNVCQASGDCCSDFVSLCLSAPTTPTPKPTSLVSPSPPSSSVPGSCKGASPSTNFCMQKSQSLCWCDGACLSSGDCCSDYLAVCQGSPTPLATSPTLPPSTVVTSPTPSGVGSCRANDGSPLCNQKSTGACWCDSVCQSSGDCCPDITSVCGLPSG